MDYDESILAMAEEGRIVALANQRYSETDSYHSRMASEMKRMHHWYNPANQDQWPSDAAERPGKIHITSNIIKPAVDIDARLQSKLPRITLLPTDLSEAERARAELAEKMMLTFLEASDWELWFGRAARIKSLYRKAILKVFWNKEDRRPDVHLIEQPYNVRIGWGSSDFRVKDWALYEYSLSPAEVMRRWPNLYVEATPGDAALRVHKIEGDQNDPLNQDSYGPQSEIPFKADRLGWQPSDYEKKQVLVWDYWYKQGTDGDVYNCTIVQRATMPEEVKYHPELPDIPYIVIENDHDPGSPEGISTAEPLIDIQIEMNRALSQWQQVIVDNIDPAWQANADSLPGGVVPKAGEIVAMGDGVEAKAFEKPVNTFPVEQLVAALWNQYHRTTGLGEILFGAPASAQDSGRALAVQIESAINRLDPKRNEFYASLKLLLRMWSEMIERLNPKIDVGNGRKEGMKGVFKGLRRWKIVAPEITPRDASDHTNNVINKLNAKLVSLHTAMDELGVDSPEDEIKLVTEEQSSLPLNPGVVQAMAQVGLLMMQLQQQGLSLEQLMAGGQGGSAMPSQEGVNRDKAAQQQAQPQGTEDMNQPATGSGGVPPIDSTTLVRTTANQESQTLGQLQFQAPVGPGVTG